MNLRVAQTVSLSDLSKQIQAACPEARCTFTGNGWLRVSFGSKWATIDVDNLCHLYAREDGWLHPDVLAVVVDALKGAA